MDDASRTVSVLLQKGWLDCLRKNAAADSVEAKCLDRALDMRGVLAGTRSTYCLQCSDDEIRAVLELATLHCREAVGQIREGMRRFSR
jgi:hypothetical protein